MSALARWNHSTIDEVELWESFDGPYEDMLNDDDVNKMS